MLPESRERACLKDGIEIYRATRKKHDLLFNVYVMRPIAAVVVGLFAKTRITPNQVTILNLASGDIDHALCPLVRIAGAFGSRG